MSTKIAKNPIKVDREFYWESGEWTFTLSDFVIDEDGVTAKLMGGGPEILAQGLENDAEYADYEGEVEYSFEDLQYPYRIENEDDIENILLRTYFKTKEKY